ncbi:hypothetical protein PQO03_13410 [Lentisphaera profundi]|uniref:Membrane or secreted protein n=1 Tax=Lentisphaera profundi TaxID=1658616 RepID=A0ABY7W134_9BACT|nr:hypothetical protein [Lentisphaera profundi]WDE98832.1 hypothetical protein PQO03_13410 [Lentisphaera profundi]
MDALINIVIAAVVFGGLFFGVGLKFLAKKDDEVKGSCASRNQFLNEGGCSICGKEDPSGCDGSPLDEAKKSEETS